MTAEACQPDCQQRLRALQVAQPLTDFVACTVGATVVGMPIYDCCGKVRYKMCTTTAIIDVQIAFEMNE